MSKRTKWTYELVAAEAAKYSSRSEFKRRSCNAYGYAHSRGLLDNICGHMTTLWQLCDANSVAVEAKKYTTKDAFRKGNMSLYSYACRNGLLDEVCAHMKRAGGTDNDTIYLWRAVGQFFNGEPVYKIGVTSSRLGSVRIDYVGKEAGFEIEVLCQVKVKGMASRLEKSLHRMGQDPQYLGFNGCSEFRALSDHQLAAVMTLINEAAE